MHRYLFCAFLAFTGSLDAQPTPKAEPVQIRMILHDPVNPICQMYYMDVDGKMAQVPFRSKDLSAVLSLRPINQSLVFFDKMTIDPKKPMENLSATIKIPEDFKRGMLVVLPAKAGEKPAYRLVLIDDRKEAFPAGESRILSLVNLPLAVRAGEHQVITQPGKIGKIPAVKKVNDFHMAQTNFAYQSEDKWVVLSERQLQYTSTNRRLFIAHVTPGALQPTITTIVDTIPNVLPQ